MSDPAIAAAAPPGQALPAPGPAGRPVPIATLVGPVTEVGIAALRPADSPRLAGTDRGHARALAELGTDVSPILVNRRTMRVVDGMHRVAAARANGQQRIRVQFCEGTDEESFVLSVALNAGCGLPLTLADRRAAAARILRSYPQLSNRSIAATVHLAPNTVARIRQVTTVHPAQSHRRLGRDGRMRPVDGTGGRRAAGAVVDREPDAPLREIAARSGVSLGTARSVRDRVRNGQSPVPAPRRRRVAAPLPDPRSVLDGLRADPSLRYKESGRSLLRWLDSRTVAAGEWREHVASLPPHCASLVGRVARGCAAAWTALAEDLERRADRLFREEQ